MHQLGVVGKDGAHPLAQLAKVININLVGSFNMIRLAAEARCKKTPEATGERGVLISTASGCAPSLPTVLMPMAMPAQLSAHERAAWG